MNCTYCASEVGIILVGLACRVISGCKAAVTERVRIVTADKIYSTGIIGSVVVVWLCSDSGSIACERNTHTPVNENQILSIKKN